MSSGDASLAGAEFTFRYYDGQYATAAETEASGAPTRTWAFKTNEKGRIRIMDESLKVSGDDLFYNSMGQITLPIGTLLIQETKAPEGYLIDPTVYVRNITPDGTLEAVNSYNAPTVSEQVVTGRIQIVKHTDTGTTKVETPEVGATFNIYLASAGSYDAAPANARAQLTIDKDGFAVSPDLPYGLYTVEQTSGWEGSRLMEPFTVKIDENGKTYSYIQSWIKVLEKDPQELFAAIKDASGIANYLMEKGEFLQNITEEKRQIRHIEAENIDQEKFDFYAKDPVDLRFVGCTFRNVTVSESEARLSQFKDCKFYGCDTRSVQDRSVFTHAAFFPADAAVRQPERRESKYIPADMIELARSQDVFDILQRTGEPLFQKDGQWRSVEHDSLVVTPGKGYYWFSRAEGSKSPIDYFVNVHGMGFQEAVRTVLEAIHRDVTYTPPVWLPPAEHEEFRPLPRAKTNLDAYNYLVQERGLDQELVDGLMRQGRIYQSGKYKNVVFVGTDFDGVVASNFARSCDPTQQVQRFDVRGSQKEYRFRMENPDCPRCNVFESEIDLLSYLSMRPADQRTENYIALGGVSPRALLAFLQYRPDVSQINLCTDGDRAGEQCAESIRTLLEGQYEISREAAPIGKDWNESLVRIRELQESWEHETNDPETETWRDDLTSQEAQIVAAWDDGFDHGLARMVTLSRTQDDPGLRSAMAKLDPVEQVRSPFARKAEDWTY